MAPKPQVLTEFICSLPDGSKSGLTIDGEGAGKLVLMLSLPEAQKVSAAYHGLIDKALLCVVVEAPE